MCFCAIVEALRWDDQQRYVVSGFTHDGEMCTPWRRSRAKLEGVGQVTCTTTKTKGHLHVHKLHQPRLTWVAQSSILSLHTISLRLRRERTVDVTVTYLGLYNCSVARPGRKTFTEHQLWSDANAEVFLAPSSAIYPETSSLPATLHQS
jgi:hypothetical protein